MSLFSLFSIYRNEIFSFLFKKIFVIYNRFSSCLFFIHYFNKTNWKRTQIDDHLLVLSVYLHDKEIFFSFLFLQIRRHWNIIGVQWFIQVIVFLTLNTMRDSDFLKSRAFINLRDSLFEYKSYTKSTSTVYLPLHHLQWLAVSGLGISSLVIIQFIFKLTLVWPIYI